MKLFKNLTWIIGIRRFNELISRANFISADDSAASMASTAGPSVFNSRILAFNNAITKPYGNTLYYPGITSVIGNKFSIS